MIIGISGKIGSGKDLVGEIIQYLTRQNTDFKGLIHAPKEFKVGLKQYPTRGHMESFGALKGIQPTFTIKKFGGALKDIVCILTGCTREQLEDRVFKEQEIGEDWLRWYYSFYKLETNTNDGRVSAYFTEENKDKVLHELCEKLGHDPESFHLNKEVLTYRKMLQLIGTECMRNFIHPNTWANTLMSKYQSKFQAMDILNTETANVKRIYEVEESKWIITDVRFPNELKAVETKGGISIRVIRDKQPELKKEYIIEHKFDKDEKEVEVVSDFDIRGYDKVVFIGYDGVVYRVADWRIVRGKEHESETALDRANFQYIIDNEGTVEDLVTKVRELLIKEKVI